MSFVQQGKLDRAIAEYQAILKADPSDFNVLNSLGDLCARTGNKAEAIAHFMRLGEVYGHDGFYVRAVAVYKKVLKLDPSHTDASLACADMYGEQGLIAEAKLQLQGVADQFLKRGDLLKALWVYEKMIQIEPGSATTVQKIAQMLVKTRRVEEAVAQLTRLGKSLIGSGQTQDARQIHEKVVELLTSQRRGAEAARFTEGFRQAEAEAGASAATVPPSSEEDLAEVGMEEAPVEVSSEIGGGLAAEREALEPAGLESQDDGSLLMEELAGAGQGMTLDEMLEKGVPGSGGMESGGEAEPAGITLETFPGSEDPPTQSEQVSDSVALAGSATVEEEVQEGEFFLQQGMTEEARAVFQRVLLRDPEHALAKRRLERIEQMAGDGHEKAALVEEPRTEPTSQVSPPQKPQKPARVKVTQDSAPEGDFVDLAGEIERELPPEEEPEVRGVLQELERGIREQVDAADYETHYNLGIAYKDMELYDKAFEQFRLAAKDATYRVRCASLMGLCYLALGQAERAVEELNQGLSATEGGTEERWSVLYDMATAYEALGDTKNALEALRAIHEEAPKFRDVRVRIRDLRERLEASRG